MPRRIRLDVEANPDGLVCDLTGEMDEMSVRTYRTRPHGAAYEAFVHPLSPHYKAKKTESLADAFRAAAELRPEIRSELLGHAQPGETLFADVELTGARAAPTWPAPTTASSRSSAGATAR